MPARSSSHDPHLWDVSRGSLLRSLRDDNDDLPDVRRLERRANRPRQQGPPLEFDEGLGLVRAETVAGARPEDDRDGIAHQPVSGSSEANTMRPVGVWMTLVTRAETSLPMCDPACSTPTIVPSS